jgi:hypothetical protein
MDRDLELRRLAADLQRPERYWSDEDRAMWDAARIAVMAYVPDGHDLHDLDLSMVPTEILREALRVGKLLLAESEEPWT